MCRVLVISAVILAAAGANAAVNTNPKARLAAAGRVVRDVQAAIPREYWDKARCVVAFPELKNTEFVVGGKYGKGVMSCRTSYGWSTPAFIEMKKGARMSQVGAQEMDIVLLLMNEGAAQRVQQQPVTLGADASITPGPIDSQARVDLTTQRADILTYSKAKGLYMNLGGGVLRPDDDANGDVYGKGATLRTILAGREVVAPTEAQGFIAALSNQPAAPVAVAPRRIEQGAAAPARLPAAFPRMTAEDDLRARVVELQQNLDRMLGDTVPAPVGTSGTGAPATVMVDRAQLLALRQQLDVILAALNRR
jgi:SH3 domain-containing YSC84-like protein 1